MLEILKEELEAKIDRSLLEVLLMILLRKTILLRLCSKTAKNLHKKPCVFCHKNNHASNRCLKISEPSARKLFLKDNKLCFLCLEKEHSVKYVALLILAMNAKETIILQFVHILKTRTVLIPLQLQFYQPIQTTFSCKPQQQLFQILIPQEI